MQPYKNEGFTISNQLDNGYIITATYMQQNREHSPEKFNVALRMNHQSTDWLDKVEDITITAAPNQIKSAIFNYILSQYQAGKLNYYFGRYDEMLKCYNRGYELYEAEEFKAVM